MDRWELVAEKVGMLMKAECELLENECLVKRQRSITIPANSAYFQCTLDLDISFAKLKVDGCALNRAVIYLLPEELPAFAFTLIEYPLPLPTHYQQRVEAGPNIVCFYMESKEPPEDFAERLSAALQTIEQTGRKSYII
ncbi:hypothetical protein [Planomicrobium sp. CPCC 101110]|uniref:hypothetical protein n=1 Tax=Planomicrobium sp. CPCC 101110 TaxID=2599619 RepID=UPI0011B82BA6|nr:hypothetical protein [Planomicrobium sp. CPCC 101110]TWT27171.1 hypothetical protein FQV30_01245 [Planomicrobium sp. CPCC 101110]